MSDPQLTRLTVIVLRAEVAAAISAINNRNFDGALEMLRDALTNINLIRNSLGGD